MENKIIEFYKKEIKKEKIEWILFDCFDTILHRKIHTDNIKMIWAENICSKLCFQISPRELYKIRKEAEQNISLEKGIIIKEYTYRELLEQICLCLSFCEEPHIIFDKTYEVSLNIELELESKYCSIDEQAKEAINFFIQNGINLALVSDFYLGKEELASLLDKFDLNIFCDIFVSSDFKKAKYSGELYDEILSLMEVRASNVLMIGDNIKSDILCAKRKGIRTFYKKWRNYPINKDYNYIEKQLKILSKRNMECKYENYAFALYYFIDELYRRLVNNEVNEVLFLAREGELLKVLFEKYLENKNESDIKAFYFCTSRIASFAAGLRSLKEETFEGLFNKYQDMSINTFLKSMGWPQNKIEILENEIILDIEEEVKNFKKSPEFAALKRNDTFIDLYNMHRLEQNNNLKCYLKQMGVHYEKGIHIVDVGWRGTIQDNIYRCFNEEVDVHGYYIGLSKLWSNSKNNMKEGLVFGEYPYKSPNFNIWNFDKFMFERILLASHPTTVGYNMVDNKVVPIYKGFLKEKEAYQYIHPFQERIKNVYIEILDIFSNTVFHAKDFASIFTVIHLKMLCNIGMKEINMQKKLYHYNHESFGEFRKSKVNYIGEILLAVKKNKIPIHKILKGGISFKYVQSISITTFCVAHNIGWLLPILYRLLYCGEIKKIK